MSDEMPRTSMDIEDNENMSPVDNTESTDDSSGSDAYPIAGGRNLDWRYYN